MKEWFTMNTDNFNQVDWINGPYASYKGPLLTDGHSASITGGFGDILLQGSFHKLYNL